jgi:serine/threonine-protein kinase
MDFGKRIRWWLEGLGAATHFVALKPRNGQHDASRGVKRATASTGKPGGSSRPANGRERSSSLVLPVKRDLRVIGGRYQLLDELGNGRGVAVYRALDLRIGRIVVLKAIIAADLSPKELRRQRERIYQEARTAGRTTHPGIVTVHDLATDEAGHPYIVMECVEGETLDQVLNRRATEGPLNLAQRLAIAIQLATALDYAHRNRVVHRDIKPSNILISENCTAKIVDFGIALVADGKTNGDGQLPGTPAFVAPELLKDSPASPRSDIFSLGVVLYWMFTGEMPFSGNTVTEIVHNVAHTDVPPAREVNWALPEELDEMLGKCLAKNPAGRYPSAGMLAADLVALRDGKARPVRVPQHAVGQTADLYQMK